MLSLHAYKMLISGQCQGVPTGQCRVRPPAVSATSQRGREDALTLHKQGVCVEGGELLSDPHALPCSSRERGLSRPWRSTWSGT